MSALRSEPALGLDFLRSATATQDCVVSWTEANAWLARRRRDHALRVARVPLSRLDQWRFGSEPLRLQHVSGGFFAVQGIRVRTDHGLVPQWDQPIISQPEIGILGFVTRLFKGARHFLVQAKAEPGNSNGVQLAPTVQATRSNYSRVHGGLPTRRLEYFVEPGKARVLVDQLQSEQGARFLRKRNRNMIVEIDEDLTLDADECWLTLGQIKQFLRLDGLVNMDARTVLACAPVGPGVGGAGLEACAHAGNGFARDLILSASQDAQPAHTQRELLHWLTELRARSTLEVEARSLDRLDGWVFDGDTITHETGFYFSVIGVDVETGRREVRRWQQPLLHHPAVGLNGFILQKIGGVLHLLVQACLQPGNREVFELGPTVSRSNADRDGPQFHAPAFLSLFRHPPEDWVRYSAVQSEEGGRFHHYHNRYVLLLLPGQVCLQVPETHRWMTLAQVQSLVAHGYFNIEARNLIACLDFASDVGVAAPSNSAFDPPSAALAGSR